MNAGTQISQLEKAQNIPNGSMFITEMGDGSGTKAVEQEVLTQEIGERLKVGNVEELQTENKENLVAAINEAAQSGGGSSSVDILDSKEEIEANTESGKVAGAHAVKEMFSEINSCLKGFEPVLDESGRMTGYKTSVGGADTVFPFTSSKLTIRGTIYADVRQNGQWMNRSSRSFTLTIQNGQTNISVESGDGVIAAMAALDVIRSRLVIDSVSID